MPFTEHLLMVWQTRELLVIIIQVVFLQYQMQPSLKCNSFLVNVVPAYPDVISPSSSLAVQPFSLSRRCQLVVHLSICSGSVSSPSSFSYSIVLMISLTTVFFRTSVRLILSVFEMYHLSLCKIVVDFNKSLNHTTLTSGQHVL